jgi:hypothetical protein
MCDFGGVQATHQLSQRAVAGASGESAHKLEHVASDLDQIVDTIKQVLQSAKFAWVMRHVLPMLVLCRCHHVIYLKLVSAWCHFTWAQTIRLGICEIPCKMVWLRT